MRATRNILIMVIALAVLAPPVFADEVGDIDCHQPQYVNVMKEAKKRYQEMLAHDKAGRAKAAYAAASDFDPYCVSMNEQEIKRVDAEKEAVLKRSSLKLGAEAESKGRFTEAFGYYEIYDGIAADRVKMKLAISKPDDFEIVRAGYNYFRNTEESLSRDDNATIQANDRDYMSGLVRNRFLSVDELNATDPEREKRLRAITGYRGKLDAIATKNGEKFLADEDKVFTARKTSITAKGDSLDELEHAKAWLELARQEKRANDRAVKRGDTLLVDDSRKSLELAISYYHFADNEKLVHKVKDKARRLGDAQLQKGDKVMAADYYEIAGLSEKAVETRETHEAEKERSEAKRQEQFKKDQKSLEDELGL